MAGAPNLSPAKCILLAASLASNSDISELKSLVASQPDLFGVELTCRILLSFLPETVLPQIYVPFLLEIADGNLVEGQDESVDSSAVEELTDSQAQIQLRKLHLLPLRHKSVPEDATEDAITLFLIHRVHRVDTETSLLSSIPELITPFLDRSKFLRDWFIGVVVPFLRSEYEYFPVQDSLFDLQSFEELEGHAGVATILSKTEKLESEGTVTRDTIAREFRDILGPWITAGTKVRGLKRKRGSNEAISQKNEKEKDNAFNAASTSSAPSEWQSANEWLVSKAADNFALTVQAFEEWRGPGDVDLGVPEEYIQEYQPEETVLDDLQKNYTQASFASIYVADQDTPEVIDGAYRLLVRVADLLDFDPPPDLATGISMLPKIEPREWLLQSSLLSSLQTDALLSPGNPLTSPNKETFSLLQMLVYSSYLLASLGRSLSVLKVAKLRFSSEDEEQLRFVQRITRGLANEPGKSKSEWQSARDTMLWLRNWNIATESEEPKEDFGVFGRVNRSALEIELLKAACTAGQYDFVKSIYLAGDAPQLPLSRVEVESVVISLALHYYDNASNGNRTRGGVKKASDILTAFRTHFPDSSSFDECECLIKATHALSFYSLTLQRGVPFQPASVRTSEDPVGLIEKVLEQNRNSYTKLEDLLDISRNLVKARSVTEQSNRLRSINLSDDNQESRQFIGERRVISMAIESALSSDDFETAYSYVVNRLSPSTPKPSSGAAAAIASPADDISWRAALLAGRARSAHTNQAKPNNSTTSAQVRRLEQRMEVLSHALQLAPSHNLPEALAAWRRVEEELLALVAQEDEAEREFDDSADRGEVRRPAPGAFAQSADLDSAAGLTIQPRRKELGRGAREEAPMGLFDVARGAAAAFSRSTSGSVGPAQAANRTVSGAAAAHEHDADGRRRKRDMVASAVTGGLASGLGWVLGAKPVHDDDE